MRLSFAINLCPTEEQAVALKQTLERCNKAATWVAKQAFQSKTFGTYAIHKKWYLEIRYKFGLSAQQTVLTISKVADAFMVSKAKAPSFRPLGAQAFDARNLSFKIGDIASIETLNGRVKVPYILGEHQKKYWPYRVGESDLLFMKGKWFLVCGAEIGDTETITPTDILGIDLGIVKIAMDSDGHSFSGKAIDTSREWQAKRKSVLQQVNTPSAKRRMKKLSGQQSRFQKHTNHCISKQIVEKAKDTNSAIALEDLKGIRKGVTVRKSQRSRLHNWGFYQLRQFIAYKAKRNGIPVIFVNPRGTSHDCPRCKHNEKANRKSQSDFSCVVCGYSNNADLVGAMNIRARAAVTLPMGIVDCSQSNLQISSKAA